jgi:hypothetical protein
VQSMDSNETLYVKCVKHADVCSQRRMPVRWSKACQIQWYTQNILIWYGNVLSKLRFRAPVQSITIVPGIETAGERSREREAEIGQGQGQWYLSFSFHRTNGQLTSVGNNQQRVN